MDNNGQPNEKLIRYLDGELTGEALSAFEKLLTEDADMRAELENLQAAKLVVQHYGLKQQVASVHQEMMNEFRNEGAKSIQRKSYPFIRYTMRIAAGLFVLLFLFGAYEYITVSPSRLSADHYRPYEPGVERGAKETSVVEKAYTNKDYYEVISGVEKNKKHTVKDYFLSAQAYLVTQQFSSAIREFNTVLRDSSGNYKDDAEYYLAITYLRNNEPAKTKPLFEKIYHDSDHLYHDRVTCFTLLKLKLLLIKNPGR
ncbi:hypothetical protein SNE25_19810 [Mucilaginibacter sabulilitoris]|uniref:Tetratricopeptide repeat protein n=1 Tax=Mucilaginibacter sabulilitoris TaxID=1173583 RepID=A0ABZ0TJ19_9SPHI|nr:hypothetical protein [Mucilaginibacter sabulilitoris]WPU91565.1 hypothetical protein SNE25_19810 [Mucilaginibacter sabulilitoris]